MTDRNPTKSDMKAAAWIILGSFIGTVLMGFAVTYALLVLLEWGLS